MEHAELEQLRQELAAAVDAQHLLAEEARRIGRALTAAGVPVEVRGRVLATAERVELLAAMPRRRCTGWVAEALAERPGRCVICDEPIPEGRHVRCSAASCITEYNKQVSAAWKQTARAEARAKGVPPASSCTEWVRERLAKAPGRCAVCGVELRGQQKTKCAESKCGKAYRTNCQAEWRRKRRLAVTAAGSSTRTTGGVDYDCD